MDVNTPGAGEGNNAPLGTELSGGTTSNTPETPQPLELTDDSLIRVKGSDKPVKFGDVRNFQAQFTKSSQRAAALERELAQEREARQRFEAERARQNTQQPQNQDVFASLRELPYLSGEQAVEVVQGITQEVRARDQVIGALVKKIQSMDQRLGGLYETHTNSAFDSKINKMVGDLGHDTSDAGLLDLAKEVYLAYEGNDLDQEFPRIFGERLKQLETYFEARKRAALEKARRVPFVPGRGGNGGPSNPLQIKGNASPREIAELLWNNGEGTGT